MTDMVRVVIYDPIPADEVRRLSRVLRSVANDIERYGGDAQAVLAWMKRLQEAMKLAGRSDILS